MDEQWFYSRDGLTLGPVSGQHLKQLVDAGQLTGEDLIWREGMRDWVPARSIGLTGTRPLPVPPPLPPRAQPTMLPSSPAPPAPPRPRVERSRPAPAGVWIAVVLLLMAGSAAAAWMAHELWLRNSGPAVAESEAGPQPPQPARTGALQRTPARPAGPPPSSDSNVSPSPPPGATVPTTPPDANPPAPLEPTAPADDRPAADQPAPPLAPAKPQILYQRVDVAQTTQMMVEGIPVEQQLQYHLLSELSVEPPQADGTRRVTQQITAAELDHGDEMSRGTYQSSLRAMVGARLTYGINSAGNLVDFKGPKSSRAASPLSALGGSGFLVTSLLDDDGWQELIHLAFFQPDPQRAAKKSWQRQMTHNWGPLGVWAGMTTFTPRPGPSPDIEQFDYVHDMKYTPPRGASAELPFQVTDARFEPREARGIVYYDTRQSRVTRVEERFHVQGALTTSLLGQPAQLGLEELQILTVSMSDQKPAEFEPRR